MVSYFHENLNKGIGAVAQTVYTDVYNWLRRRLFSNLFLKNNDKCVVQWLRVLARPQSAVHIGSFRLGSDGTLRD